MAQQTPTEYAILVRAREAVRFAWRYAEAAFRLHQRRQTTADNRAALLAQLASTPPDTPTERAILVRLREAARFATEFAEEALGLYQRRQAVVDARTSTLEKLTVSDADLGAPWADGTRWSDGTGWSE